MDDLEHQLRTYADQVEDQVGEVTLPVRDARRSPLLLVAAAIAIMLIGAAALFLTDDDSPTDVSSNGEVVPLSDGTVDDGEGSDASIAVPDVEGLALDAARAALLDAGFDIEVEFESNALIPRDVVFGQEPSPGDRVGTDSVVTLRASAGAADTVPSVLGETQESATKILQELGYTVTVRSATSPQQVGVVLAQDPSPNTALVVGESVEIAVSSGPEVVPVPDVEGLDVVAAIDALAAAGFSIDPEQVGEPSEEIEESRVIRTEPEANTLVADGSLISIVVSTGLSTIEVPQVTDLFADTAITTLRNQGLEVATVFEQVPAGSVGIGRVLTQSPGAFEEVEVGTVITLTVGEAAPETTTTSAAP